jgi:spore photoproduct lyase
VALTAASPAPAPVRPKLWTPKRVLVTPAALEHAHGRAIAERCAGLGIDVRELPANRLTGLRGEDERETYRRAKSTLAVVVSPPGERKLQPIPPSADWQFHVARGCPAHCQYCYLAGSLPGPPVTRAFANLDEILGGLGDYLGRGTITSRQEARAHEGTTFEASCYTDPLGIEHLTGSLARAIEHFGTWDADAQLRFTTKFDAVEGLLALPHGGRTRARFSLNAAPVTAFEGGTASLPRRIGALAKMAGAGYPVGLTIAPIMPVEGWREHYGALLDDVAAALAGVPGLDLTVELITHRFTPNSKSVLEGWYPATKLEMDEEVRTLKRTKFGSEKYVYPRRVMTELRSFFEEAIADRLPSARILYWT